MSEQEKQVRQLIDEHKTRARSMSELCHKLLAKRRKILPKTYEEYLGDMDVFKRAAEHVGASQFANEVIAALFKEE